jgi:hypothetical protein
VSLEETFAKVVGRHVSDEERQRLYRLRDALGLRDNDAFWSIVMALEYYDSFFRQYPAELAEHTERCIEGARAAFAAAAEREAAQVQRTLSEKVAETSVAIARQPTSSGSAAKDASGTSTPPARSASACSLSGKRVVGPDPAGGRALVLKTRGMTPDELVDAEPRERLAHRGTEDRSLRRRRFIISCRSRRAVSSQRGHVRHLPPLPCSRARRPA